ncbi:hypothetical protein Pla175_41420 [Pirellulimonas nuda]|uniref:Uncharacterized protein n=1 Tax=Pirellulimonas nuda TaxID=2528009 RepID=A0A518DGY1_9BACT|nr:hypothetical protein [Pirellulimonas nuda]QDU90731.1 hypothetical protein Pla175_41420 [Pirellulimonas nuda]
MSKPCCCRTSRPAGRRRRPVAEAAVWVVPSVLLAATPKCPLCLAAYVALATGVGLSATVAGCLHAGLVLMCAALLSYAAARGLLRLTARRAPRA